MKIEWNGQAYALDLEEITNRQAITTQGYLGCSIMSAFGQIEAMAKSGEFEDTPELLRLVTALYWLMLAQAGERADIAEVEFPVVKFMTALFGAMAEVTPAEEAGPGPTSPPPGPALSPPSTATQDQGPSPSPDGEAATADTGASGS